MSLWIIIIASVITIGVGTYLELRYDIGFAELFTIFILGVILEGAIASSIESKQPKPIDVYRGKTTLEISYVDSIPQDTVVVWKHKQ